MLAIDIWSVGVMLLMMLTGRLQFFLSSDDTDALIEIASIFGRQKMSDCAALHGMWTLVCFLVWLGLLSILKAG